jgi:hypothetical protein
MSRKLNLSAGLALAVEQSKQQVAAVPTAEERTDSNALKERKAPKASSRIQVIVRLTPTARARLRNASQVYRLSEQELVERFVLTLPEPTEAPKLPF